MGFRNGKSHGGKHGHGDGHGGKHGHGHGDKHDHGGKHDKWDWQHGSHHHDHHGKHDQGCKPPPPPPPPPQDGAPAIEVVKSATPTTTSEGSQSVTYTYVLTNTSTAGAGDPLSLTSLVDDHGTPGNTADDINLLTGGTLVGGDANANGLLDFGETWTYQYTANVVLDAGETLTNQVTVVATDNEGATATDSAVASVNAQAVAPAVNVEKTAVPLQVREGSASVTYQYSVTNTSEAGAQDPLMLTTLVDDRGTTDTADDVNLLADANQDGVWDYYVSGDTDGDKLVEQGEAWIFSYTTEVVLNVSGLSELTNFVTVVAQDDEGSMATDTAYVTVNSRGAAPAINVEMTATPATVAAGGESVTYGYEVTNTSTAGAQDPMKLFSLADDRGTTDTTDDVDLLADNNQDGAWDYFVGGDTDGDKWVDQGEAWLFSYTTQVMLGAGESLTNTATVGAADDEGAMDEEDPILVYDTDSATVTALQSADVVPANSYDVDLFTV